MKQFLIIGLGNFGYYLATKLYEMGHEVMAMDKDPELVSTIKDNVTKAVVADSTDKKTLEYLNIKDFDTAVVCIGSSLSQSILTVMHLKDLGVKTIYSKSISESHTRILYKLGVSEVIFPERDQAVSLARRLDNPNMLEYFPFLSGYSIVQVSTPQEFVGKTLIELNLPKRYGIQIVAIKEAVPDRINMIPPAGFLLKETDSLIMIGPEEAVKKIGKKK